jgi:hypothetical protein
MLLFWREVERSEEDAVRVPIHIHTSLPSRVRVFIRPIRPTEGKEWEEAIRRSFISSIVSDQDWKRIRSLV